MDLPGIVDLVTINAAHQYLVLLSFNYLENEIPGPLVV